MPFCALIIDSRGGFGSALRNCFLFAGKDEATEVFTRVRDAAVAYHARNNDRERIITFTCVTGEAAIDLSDFVTVFVEDALGGGREALLEWNRGMAELREAGALVKDAGGEVPA